jgi:hypothetical protein
MRSCAAPFTAVAGFDDRGIRYRVSANHPLETFLGLWGCRSPDLAVALDPGDGEVWAFDSWPGPGSRTVGRLVADVGPASGASVVARSGGCALLLVERVGAPPIEIDPAPR